MEPLPTQTKQGGMVIQLIIQQDIQLKKKQLMFVRKKLETGVINLVSKQGKENKGSKKLKR